MPTTLSGRVLIAQDVYAENSIQQHDLGEKGETADGRVFRYCLVGATAIVPGKIYQAPDQVANHLNLTVTAAVAIAGTSVTVTLGGTAATANQYREGLANIYDGTGAGYSYKIASHPAQATTTGNLAVALDDPIRVALDTTSKVSLVLNPYKGVIALPTTATSAPVGLGVENVTAAYYGWLQTRGYCVVLNDAGTTVGLGLAPSAATEGAVKTMAATLCQVGYALQTGTTTKYCGAFLTID